MPHFGSAGIGSLGNQRNSQNLMAMMADNLPGILIGVFDFFFFYPK
jgi:hypothetical protein